LRACGFAEKVSGSSDWAARARFIDELTKMAVGADLVSGAKWDVRQGIREWRVPKARKFSAASVLNLTNLQFLRRPL
jgi:hypothetical protein